MYNLFCGIFLRKEKEVVQIEPPPYSVTDISEESQQLDVLHLVFVRIAFTKYSESVFLIFIK